MTDVGLEEIHKSIVQTWNVVPVDKELIEWDDLIDSLSKRIAYLLRHDLQLLLNNLYLLDIHERHYEEAQALNDQAAAARLLAKAVLEREEEKRHSRKSYRRERSVDVPFSVREDDMPSPDDP